RRAPEARLDRAGNALACRAVRVWRWQCAHQPACGSADAPATRAPRVQTDADRRQSTAVVLLAPAHAVARCRGARRRLVWAAARGRAGTAGRGEQSRRPE